MTIPYDLDPSLHNVQPHEPRLDDGFTHPSLDDDAPDAHAEADEPEALIGDKSAF